MVLTKYVISILVSLLALPVFGASAVFNSEFQTAGIAQWEAYGTDAKLDIVNDTKLNRKVLVSLFDDTSNVEWCNSGAKVIFQDGISWNDFKYVYCHYKVTSGISSVGFLLHDSNGSWWLAFQARDLTSEKWSFAGVKSEQFKFGYNDNPAITGAEKTSKIKEMIVYVTTAGVNTGTRYALYLDGVVLSNSLSDGENSSLSVSKSFDLQWKNRNINSSGYMLVDGKPFFPLGLYTCLGIDQASGNSSISYYSGPTDDKTNLQRFKAIKNAGFNLIQTYTMNLYGQKVSGTHWNPSERQKFPAEDGETTPELYRKGMLKFLDYAESAGLKVMAGAYSSYSINKPLPLFSPAKVWKERAKVLRDNITALANHPALLLWYLIDEPGSVNMPVDDLTICYRYIKTLDQMHPLYIASADYTGDVQYMKAVDIYAPDSYPLAFDKPLMSESEKLDFTAKHQTGSPLKPYLWQIIQICQWIDGRPLPTARQIRLMALLALTRDVKGLMFYEHKNYPETNPEQWANISQAVSSLHSVIPDIPISHVVKKYSVSNNQIQTIMRKVTRGKKNYYILIAVNAAQDTKLNPVSQGMVTFDLSGLSIPRGASVIALDEDKNGEFKPGSKRVLDFSAKVLNDTFKEWDAHIYRITPK